MFSGRVGLPIVALCTCLGAPVRGSFAQTLPLPAVPPPLPPPPEPKPAAPGAVPEADASTEPQVLELWEYLVGVGGGYSSNLYFLPQGPGGSFLTPHAELTRVSRGPTSESRLTAAAGSLAYLAPENQLAVDASLTATGRQQLSGRATFSGDISGGLGHTEDNVVLSEQGVLLPFSRTRFARAQAGVLWNPTARTALELSGRAYYDDFVAPELIDGRSVRGSLRLGRRLGEHSELSAEYAVELAKSDATYTTQFASLQLDHRLSERTSILIEGGSSHTAYSISELAPAWNFYGGVSLARGSGPSSTVLYVRREVIPAFGIGGLGLTDRVGLRTSARMGRSWQISAEATYFRRSAAQPGAGRADSGEGRVALQRTVGRRFELGSELEYRRYAPEPQRPAIEQLRAQLTLEVTSPKTGSQAR